MKWLVPTWGEVKATLDKVRKDEIMRWSIREDHVRQGNSKLDIHKVGWKPRYRGRAEWRDLLLGKFQEAHRGGLCRAWRTLRRSMDFIQIQKRVSEGLLPKGLTGFSLCFKILCNFTGKGNILYLDCGGYMTVYICQSHWIVYLKSGELVRFTLCKLYLNKPNPQNKTTLSWSTENSFSGKC